MKRIYFFLIAIVLLGLFTGFSKTVKRGSYKSIDFDVTVKIQDKISPRLDQFMDDGAILADGIVSSVLIITLTAYLFFDRKKRKVRWAALAIPVAFFFLGITEIYGKNFVPHAGPPFFMLKQPTTVFPKFHIAQPFSYPSGHAARSMFLATITAFVVWQKLAKKKEKAALILTVIFIYTVFVWVSRIYLGHHWLTDIIGGILLGGGSAMTAASFFVSSKK